MQPKITVATAKVYQFPRKLASVEGVRRLDASVSDGRMQRLAIADFDSWYHQAAIEADRIQKP